MSTLLASLDAVRHTQMYRSSPPVVKMRKAAAGMRQRAKDRLRPFVDPPRREVDRQHMAMLVSWLLNEDSVAVAVGAHSGEILDLFLKSAPKARHIAIEPLSQFYLELVARYPGVTVHSVAVGEREGTFEFVEVVDAPALSGLRSAQLEQRHTTHLANGGFFVFDQAIFEYLSSDDRCDLEVGPLEQLAQKVS